MTGIALGGPGNAISSAVTGTFRHGDLSGTGAAQIHDAPGAPLTYIVPPASRNLPYLLPVSDIQRITGVDRGSGAYLGLNYKDLSFMSAHTEWQSNSFTAGLVSGTRLTRAFGNLGYKRAVTAWWDMDFNVTFTRTTFNTDGFPGISRDSHEFVAEWTNLVTITPRDRLTAGALFNRVDGLELLTGSNPIVPDSQVTGQEAPFMPNWSIGCVTI